MAPKYLRYTRGEGCPVCIAIGEEKPSGGRCAMVIATGVVHCRKGPPCDVPGWRHLGPGSSSCQAYARRGPLDEMDCDRWRAKPKPPKPKKKKAERVRPSAAAMAAFRDLCADHAIQHAREAQAFAEAKGATWNPATCTPGPTADEASAILAEMRLRYRELTGWWFRPAALAEWWQWILGPDGEVRAWGARIIHHGDDPKTKYPYGVPRMVHYADGWRDRLAASGVLLIAEAPVKADIAAREMGCGAVGVPGVHFGGDPLKELLALIETVRPSRVLLAPDLPDLTNGEKRHDGVRGSVAGNWCSVAEAAQRNGAEVRWLVWDGDGHGIDDALLAGDEVTEVEWSDYRARWRWFAEPASESDRPPYVDVADLRADIAAKIAAWDRTRSLCVVAPPDAGKTTAAVDDTLARLRADGGIAAVGLPTREAAIEKADYAVKHARGVRVVKVLGAHEHPESKSWCEAYAIRTARAELLRYGCRGCQFFDVCNDERGRYRHSMAHVRASIEDGGPLLLVGTVESIRSLVGGGDLPPGVPFVLDDAGCTGGLIRTIQVDRGMIHGARDNLASYETANMAVALAAVRTTPAGKVDVPDAIVERLADQVAVWAADAYRKVEEPGYRPRWERDPDAPDMAAIVAWLPDIVRDAIRAGQVRSPAGRGWEWERDDPESLAWTTAAIRAVQAHLYGHDPTATRHRGAIEIHVPDLPMIWQAKAGNVLWLAVGALPAAMIEAVGAKVVEANGRPRTLHVVAIGGRNWGAGTEGATRRRTEACIRALAAALAEKAKGGGITYKGRVYHGFGAVLHKRDREAMEKPDWCGSFGEHMAHNRQAECGTFLVRRWAKPSSVIANTALILGRCFGIDPERLLVDVIAFEDAHAMRNAGGRPRPFSAAERGEHRLVIVADQQAAQRFGWTINETRKFEDLAAELGLVGLPTAIDTREKLAEINERRQAEAARTAAKVYAARAADSFASDREIAERLGLALSTVQQYPRDIPTDTGVRTTLYSRVGRNVSPCPWWSVDVVAAKLKWETTPAATRRSVRRILQWIWESQRDAEDDEDGGDDVPVDLGARATGKRRRRLEDVLKVQGEMMQQSQQGKSRYLTPLGFYHIFARGRLLDGSPLLTVDARRRMAESFGVADLVDYRVEPDTLPWPPDADPPRSHLLPPVWVTDSAHEQSM